MRPGLSPRVRPGRARVRRPTARTAAVRSTSDPTDARSKHRFRRRAARHAADPTPPPDREPPGHPVPLPARVPTPSSGRLRARRLADRRRRSRDGPPDEAGRRSSRWAGRGAPAAGRNAGCRGTEHGLRTDRGHAGRRPAGAEGRRGRRGAAEGRRLRAVAAAPAAAPRPAGLAVLGEQLGDGALPRVVDLRPHRVHRAPSVVKDPGPSRARCAEWSATTGATAADAPTAIGRGGRAPVAQVDTVGCTRAGYCPCVTSS